MINFFTKTLIFLFLIILTAFWSYENPEIFEKVKCTIKYEDKCKKKMNVFIPEEVQKKEAVNIEANAFSIKLEEIISLNSKTAFLLNDSKGKSFNKENIFIYTQNGYKISKKKKKKLKLNKNFNSDFNGGIKTIFFHNKNEYALVSSARDTCYYASIVDLNTGNEIFNTDCLPDLEEDSAIDFNGLGSSFVDFDDYILLSLGVPTTDSLRIYNLSQNSNSFFGKILKINKEDLKNNLIRPEVFTSGHRNPQGITVNNKKIFSVEHGPKGGDELNLIIKGENYGWPLASYGTRYLYHKDGKSYPMDHAKLGFKDPLYSFIPSIGINSLNNCPSVLKKYYKKNCLLATSLYGNKLRPGKSLVIFLLDETSTKVDALEKILLNDKLPLRHFLTNNKNEIFEDTNGSIYLSSDYNAVYRISFEDFRR